MIKRVIQRIENHAAVRFGLPVVTIFGSALLFLFGFSFFGSMRVYLAIGFLLLLTGFFTGWRMLGIVVVLSLGLIFIVGPHIVVPRVQWSESNNLQNSFVYHSPDDPDPTRLRTESSLMM